MEYLWLFETDKLFTMAENDTFSVEVDNVSIMEDTELTTDTMATQHWTEYIVAMWLVKYAFIMVVLLGTVGNILSLLVLMRKRMRYNSINFYLTVLSCADMLVLYMSGFKTWLRVVSGLELLHTSNASCKIFIFLFVFASHVSAWLIVLVTADRFIVVWFPFKAIRLCSLKRSRILVGIMLGIMAIYNLHLLFTMHLFQIGNHNQCAPLVTNHFMNGPYNFLRLATYTIIPFTLVLVMNVGIIACICNHSQKPDLSEGQQKRFVQGCHTADQRNLQNKHQVTVMLLVVSFTWLTLTLPHTVLSLINFQFPDTRTRAIVFLVKTICFLLMYLNHSINFLLYCIVGKKFRKEFLNMFQDLNVSMKWKRTNTWTLNDRTTRSRRNPSPAPPAEPGVRISIHDLNEYEWAPLPNEGRV